MSNLTNPPGGGDPPDRFRNVGEQIQSFFDFAENNPDRAVPFFVNIWETQASLTTRALALQGLGVAAQHYHVKEALADWDVLRDIAKEVKGKGEVSNDLTRWAAASALEAIGYSQQSLEHLEGGGFTEPLDRIRREIRDRKLIEINRIPRLNTRGETTAEYERHLEFWLYGPADELLNDNDSSLNYQDLIGDVISKLHGRGVFLGLISPNRIVQGAALRQARLIFKESTEIEDYLYGLLEEFLLDSKHEISLRIHAAKIINTATDINRRLKTLSQLLLEENNPKLHEVALRQAQSIFQQSAETEESLYQPLEEFLLNSNHEISLRIHAAEIINTATDINRRLKTLSKLLLEETELRNTAVRLLNPYKQELARVQSDAYTVLDALNFEYRLDKPELKNLTISQIKTHIASSSQAQNFVLAKFRGAIESTGNLARRYKLSSFLINFLENQQESYLSDISKWIHQLSNQQSQTFVEQRKIESNQLLLKDCFLAIHNFDFKLYSKLAYLEKCEEWENTDYKNFNYNHCQKQLSNLTISKNNIVDNLYKNQQKFELKKIVRYDEFEREKFMVSFVFIFLFPYSLLFLFNANFRVEIEHIVRTLILLIIVFSLVFTSLFIIIKSGWFVFIITLSIVIGIIFTIVLSINQKKTKIEQMIRKLNKQWRT